MKDIFLASVLLYVKCVASERERNLVIILILGYFVIGLIFLILRFFYHILPKKSSHNNLIHAAKNDFANLYAYFKQIFLSNLKTLKFIIVIIAILTTLLMIPHQNDVIYIFEEALATIMFFLLAIVFLPPENPLHKGFPIEILGFVYSVVFMFYSAGSLVLDTFFMLDFKEGMWIFGDSVMLISYVVCMATLRRFMERDLSTIEITLLGMIMMTTLEFITYYGIGFFNGVKWDSYQGIEWYNSQEFESNIFGNVTAIINQGIYLSSQSQILERNSMEIWAYIILNGTDVLTVTVVLGYVLQKFFGNSLK